MVWTPQSWQEKPQEQQADYHDSSQLRDVIDELQQLPPLVSPKEVLELRRLTAEAAEGKVFLLQGGDCAESFADCNQAAISRKLQLLLQMGLVLMHGLGKPVVRVGRMAGQYAKPRSSHVESKDGLSLPSYRGDLINDIAFEESSRAPDPARLLKGYSLASLTLNFIRTFGKEQVTQFCDERYWQPETLLGGKVSDPYQQRLKSIQQSLRFIEQLSPESIQQLQRFYTCHEALHLHYEQALTRQDDSRWFNLSTHMPWVGMRTAKPDSAHIEYLRGIENPVAIKVGPRMTMKWLEAIIQALNPTNEAGKICLITRLGHEKVSSLLPELIRGIQDKAFQVTWISDPMHGNTRTTNSGQKTRFFDDINAELGQAAQIHRQLGSVLGGVHLELTGESVTECIGGHCLVEESDLHRDYRSLVDPRLNRNQAIELAINLAESYKNQSTGETNLKNKFL